jgi:phosphate acetyltransferase
MSSCLYVASAAPKSGKSIVVLGLMSLFCGSTRRVGFFRPIVQSDGDHDETIALMVERYDLEGPREEMYGVSANQASDLVAAGKTDVLFNQIIGKFDALRSRNDLVICVGTDFEGPAAALEFDFNAEMANHLGCAILPVVNARNQSADQVSDLLKALLTTLSERHCDVVAAVINRVNPEVAETVQALLVSRSVTDVPVYILPETTTLSLPSVDDIARATDAEWIGAKLGASNRVANYLVAAMELPNFLASIKEGSLIITPGDRADIVVGTLLAHRSENYPAIAGLMLTGGLTPAPQVQSLISGLQDDRVPVLSVAADTYTTVSQVNNTPCELRSDNDAKVAAALGIVDNGIDAEALLKRLQVKRSGRITPVMFEFDLVRRARASERRIVLPEGNDERILRAAEIVTNRGVAKVTLLGNEDSVRHQADSLGLNLKGISIIDPESSLLREPYARELVELRKHKGMTLDGAMDLLGDVSYFGTMMVHKEDADGMVSGAIHTTAETIRPAFQIIRTQPGGAIVSSVFLMCMASRVLVYGDCAVNPDPTAEQLAMIAVSSAATAAAFGIEPRIAMLSYSTGDSGTGEQVEKVREATRLVRENHPDLLVEGPIQYDAAIDPKVAAAKAPNSKVAGRATVFIFPDLNTGNNTYKAVQRASGAIAVGPVLQGLNKPVNDLSRGCSVKDVVTTVAVTAIQSQE